MEVSSMSVAMPRRKFMTLAGMGAAAVPIAMGMASAGCGSDGGKWRIGVFSKHLQWLDYKGMAETAAGIGFDHVDLTVRPGGHVLPERVEEDLPRAVEAVRKAGLEVLMMTTSITAADQPHTEAILRTAGKLGIQAYRLGSLDFDEKISIEENLKLHERAFRELADLNETCGIKGDYQNHAGNRVGAPLWDLWLLLKAVNSPWMGCQFDIRHATVEGANTWPLGFRLLLPYIHTMDIKDFFWEKSDGRWRANNVPLGEGMVDWKAFMGRVKEAGLVVPLSMHFEYPIGGAEHGATRLAIEAESVIRIMKKDLDVLKGMLP